MSDGDGGDGRVGGDTSGSNNGDGTMLLFMSYIENDKRQGYGRRWR